MTRSVDSLTKEMFAAAVCKQIRESRRRQRLTQAQVAGRTGGLVSKAALANYETGHRSLRVDVLWVIARALGENLGTMLATAERGLVGEGEDDELRPVTIDVAALQRSADSRLLPVTRWVSLTSESEPSSGNALNPTLMVLDVGAINALAALMGASPVEARSALLQVEATGTPYAPTIPEQGCTSD